MRPTIIVPIVLLLLASAEAALAQSRRQIAPHALLDRLNRMKPAQRERALQRLPPERRRMVEERLDRYNRMSPEERARLRGQYDIFQELRPEDKDAVRKLFRRFSRFPDDRRTAMRDELDELRKLGEAERRARMGRDEFRNRFSVPERRLLENLSGLLPAPD